MTPRAGGPARLPQACGCVAGSTSRFVSAWQPDMTLVVHILACSGPDFLRTAAAATAAAAGRSSATGSASSATAGHQWRWGMDEWGQQGPTQVSYKDL